MAQQAENRKRRRRTPGARPTVADVAAAAGVSQMTVSRVINREMKVQPATREKVERAIAALGYVPNPAARSLAGGNQCRLALLYGNPSNAYLAEFLAGSLKGADEHDVQLTIEHWRDGETAKAILLRLQANRIDAVLLPPPLSDAAALIASFAEAGLAIAQVATGQPAATASAVTIGDEAAAHAMTAHLIGLGHRRIGFIAGDRDQTASALRRAGYERALRDGGLALDRALIQPGDFTYRSGLRAAETLLDLADRPTAIFASNDDMAAAVVSVAHRRHLMVPTDLSVSGFDDTAMATSVWPELTTVRQPIAEMSRLATQLLADTVRARRHGKAAGPKHRQLDFTLIERGSTIPLIR
jgi:LacI family transcriptional regulator